MTVVWRHAHPLPGKFPVQRSGAEPTAVTHGSLCDMQLIDELFRNVLLTAEELKLEMNRCSIRSVQLCPVCASLRSANMANF
jgi:hypothetical protein